jgi:septal ring-binding cell division protein DamX
LAVVLVSLTLSAVLYREQLQQEFKKMQDYLGQSSKASQPKEAPAIASPSVAMSSTTTLPVKADESLIPDKEVLVKEAEKTPVVPEPASAAPAVAVATAPTPAASVASPPAAAAAPTVSSDDKAWVNKLPSSQWVLQHAAFDTKNEIESLRVSQASFSDGKVLKTQRKSGAAYFILVTGPYATRAEAENLIKTNPAMAKSWLRSTKSLKSQFQD